MSSSDGAGPVAFFVLGAFMACLGVWALTIDRLGFGVGMLLFGAGLASTGLLRFRAGRRRHR